MDMQAPGREGIATHSYTAAFRVREYYHTTTGSATVLLLLLLHGQFTHSLSDAAFFHVYGIVHSRYQWRVTIYWLNYADDLLWRGKRIC